MNATNLEWMKTSALLSIFSNYRTVLHNRRENEHIADQTVNLDDQTDVQCYLNTRNINPVFIKH